MNRHNTLRVKGFVLLGILLVCVAFIILIVPVINWTANEFSWTTRSYMRLRALNLADAGAELGVWEIVHNEAKFTTWAGTNPKTLTTASFKDNNNETVGDIVASALNTSPGNYLITSTGYVPSQNDGQNVKKTVKVKVFPHALFNNAVFGLSSVSIPGNAQLDSYNSSTGPYNPLTAGDNADVGANDSLSISGNSLISGDIFIGPDGNVSGNDPSHVAGETYYTGDEVELDPVVLPGYLSSLPSQGNLALTGKDELVLPSGYYRYDNISLSSKSILTISGGSQLYVGNDFSITSQAQVVTGPDVSIYIGGSGNFAGQGIINTSGLPGDLSIYGLDSAASLSFSGGSNFYGTIYAPASDVFIGGTADFFGAVAADNVSISGNTGFHYDEALSTTGPSNGYDIAYWQED